MNEFFNNNKKTLSIGVIVIALVLVSVAVYYGGFSKAKITIFGGERTISETPLPRAIVAVDASQGRFVGGTGENVSLVSRERVVIEGGKTPKEIYPDTEREALLWAPDAKLVYIKSLGTVALDGTSSGWEVVFGSAALKAGYVISVIGGNLDSKKEITSTSFGYALPNDWYDAGEAIKSIQTLPQFKDATISGLSFYYNEDGKRWGYAISSSKGTVSVPVR